MAEAVRAAVWARVSTADQHTENQLAVLREAAGQRGLTIVAEYVTEDSAWSKSSANGKGGEFDKARAAMLAAAHRGEISVLLVWAMDRLSRRGYRDLDTVLRQLAADGCEVWSHQEPWLQTVGPFGEIILHVLAWVAEQESRRRSERTRAGLARRRDREGLPIGRQQGAKDKPETKRKRSGYVSAWEGPAGEARRAALAERNRSRAKPDGE